MTVPSGFLPPLAPSSTEPDVIEFLTRVSWSGNDLASAMQALEVCYSWFLRAKSLAVIASKRNQKLAEEFERFWRHSEMAGLFLKSSSMNVSALGDGSTQVFFHFSCFSAQWVPRHRSQASHRQPLRN